MAVNPLGFFRSVSQEVKKVTWPSRKETMISMAMVFVMVTIVAIFLFVVDQIVAYLTGLILG